MKTCLLKNKKNLLLTIIFFIVIGLTLFIGLKFKSQPPEEEEKNQEELSLEEGLKNAEEKPFQFFSSLGYFGTLTIKGYLEIQTWECKQNQEYLFPCEEDIHYTFFVIVENQNPVLDEFLKDYQGNSFVGKNKIGLGCYQEDKKRIYSINLGESGEVENIISGKELDLLLQSNQDNLVTLQLVKPVLLSGRGAPNCYSHFRNFKVWKE